MESPYHDQPCVKGERNISCKYVLEYSAYQAIYFDASFFQNRPRNKEVTAVWIYSKWMSWMPPYLKLCGITQPKLNMQNQIMKGFQECFATIFIDV